MHQTRMPCSALCGSRNAFRLSTALRNVFSVYSLQGPDTSLQAPLPLSSLRYGKISGSNRSLQTLQVAAEDEGDVIPDVGKVEELDEELDEDRRHEIAQEQKIPRHGHVHCRRQTWNEQSGTPSRKKSKHVGKPELDSRGSGRVTIRKVKHLTVRTVYPVLPGDKLEDAIVRKYQRRVKNYRKTFGDKLKTTEMDSEVSPVRTIHCCTGDSQQSVQYRVGGQDVIPKESDNLHQKDGTIAGGKKAPARSFLNSLGQMRILSEGLERGGGQQKKQPPASRETTDRDSCNKASMVREDNFFNQSVPWSQLDDPLPLPQTVRHARSQGQHDCDLDEARDARRDASHVPFHPTRPLFMQARPPFRHLRGWVNGMNRETAANNHQQQVRSVSKHAPARASESNEGRQERGDGSHRAPSGFGASTSPLDHSATNKEYEGVCIPFLDQSEDSGKEVPWMSNAHASEFSSRARLHAEILAFERWLKISKFERKARRYLASSVVQTLSSVLGDSRIIVFGSSSTGVGSVTSDVDFVVTSSGKPKERSRHWSRRERREAHLLMLRRFQKQISTRNRNFTSPIFYYARHPLITMQHRQTGTHVQIVATDMQQQVWVSHYRSEYPALRPVYFIVKSILEARGLTDVYHGGLGGYSILSMVAASFRLHPNISKMDVGEHLLAFLNFFSTFDTTKYGVDPTTPEIFAKMPPGMEDLKDEGPMRSSSTKVVNSLEAYSAADEQVAIEDQDVVENEDSDNAQDSDLGGAQISSSIDELTVESRETNQQSSYPPPDKDEVLAGRCKIAHRDPHRPYLLCLQDPANPNNDLGCKSVAIKHIIATFRHLHHVLLSSMNSDSPTSSHDAVSVPRFQPYSLLRPLVGTSFSTKVNHRRRQTVDWYYNCLVGKGKASVRQCQGFSLESEALPSSPSEDLSPAHWTRDAKGLVGGVQSSTSDPLAADRARKVFDIDKDDQLRKETARAWIERSRESRGRQKMSNERRKGIEIKEKTTKGRKGTKNSVDEAT